MGLLIQQRTVPGTTGAPSRGRPPLRASANWPDRTSSHVWTALAIGLPMAVGLIHVGVVSGRYFVGSFDDDASYILSAQGLAAGHGLAATLPSGAVLSGAYPPGYSALLAPLAWLWPHAFAPMRLLSVASFALIFLLTWWYLGRRGIGFKTRTAVLCLLALNPVLATYGSMVMAEAPFIAVFLVLLLLADRWDALVPGPGGAMEGETDRFARRRARLVTGAAVVVVAAGVVWMKEAAIGLVIGLVLWQLWQHRFRRALAVAGGTSVLLLPFIIARIVAGVPVAGSRYSQELGGTYRGGLVDHLQHVLPDSLHQLVTTALPATIVPYLTPLPIQGHWPDLWKGLSLHVSILAFIGAVSWWRHHRDSAVMVVGIYLAETLLWPYMNERRVILVLPIVTAWYVMGAAAVWRWLRARLSSRSLKRVASDGRSGIRPNVLSIGAVFVAAAVVVVPLAFQFPRDYLFPVNQSSSHPQGSRYVKLLAQMGQPSDVVETDYESTVALFTGHRTADSAFITDFVYCSDPATTASLRTDHARYLLLGDINKPGVIDNICLLKLASTRPWAVPLLYTKRDQASVFELIGPGTDQPNISELAQGARLSGSASLISIHGPSSGPNDTTPGGSVATTAQGGAGWLEWDWSVPQAVTQVSLDVANATGATTGVSLQLAEPGRGWVTVTSSRTAVGDGRGDAPYLFASLPATTRASAVRVVIDGGGVVQADGVHVLGVAS